MTNPYEKPVAMWCQICDAVLVDSSKPETGKIYQQFGVVFDTDNYTSVFYALCLNCQNEPRKAIHED